MSNFYFVAALPKNHVLVCLAGLFAFFFFYLFSSKNNKPPPADLDFEEAFFLVYMYVCCIMYVFL